MEWPKITWNHLQPPTTTYNHLQPPQKFQQPPTTTSKTSTATRKLSSNCCKLLQGALQVNTKRLYLEAIVYRAIAGANDHKGLAGPTTRNRQSCENLKIYVENFLGKMRNIFWVPLFLAEIFHIWKIEEVFFTYDAWKAVGKWG